MKYSLYILVSLLLASLVLFRAFYLRPNFWSAAILLSQSNGSLLILTNLALIWTGGTVYLLQRLFYGRLRPIEVEQLYEKGWVAVTETALALTIFREDVGARFFVMFLSLMVGKVWAWIGEGRIEFMEQQPSASRLPTIRLAASLTVSLVFDIVMLSYCLETLAREPRPGMWVMYAFEYVILLIHSTSLFLRFSLGVTESVIVSRQVQTRTRARREELRRERESAGQVDNTPVEDEIDEMDIDVPGWEDKGRWMFYLDLMTDFMKSLVYCGFFMVLLFFHGLPLHIMRDLYITVRSFIKRITDFVQYRNATKDMNARYPDATAVELEADNTCIICREEMTAWEQAVPNNQDGQNRQPDERQRPKKLPCGHILHFGCLRSWLERQRVCPTCRRSVLVRDSPTGAEPNGNARQAPRNEAQQGPAGNQQPPANNAQPARGDQAPNQFRFINVGPLRIAFGRTPGAAGVQGILQQMANRQQPANRQVQDQQPPLIPTGSLSSALATSPMLIHQQIIQLQMQVLELMQRLNGENLQLDVLERLVAELVRLQSEQQASNAGTSAQTGSLPSMSSNLGSLSSNLTSNFTTNLPNDTTQAFQSTSYQPIPGTDQVDLPPGMVLPSGYVLRRLHAVDPAQIPMQMPQNTAFTQDIAHVPEGMQRSSISGVSSLHPGANGVPPAPGSSEPGRPSGSTSEPNSTVQDRNVRAATIEDAGE